MESTRHGSRVDMREVVPSEVSEFHPLRKKRVRQAATFTRSGAALSRRGKKLGKYGGINAFEGVTVDLVDP